MLPLKYLAGYPPALLAQVHQLIAEGRLAESVARRYPEGHEVTTDRALYDYVGELKSRYMRNAPPLAKVQYDQKLHIVRNALGTHTTVSRVQGGNLKAKRDGKVVTLQAASSKLAWAYGSNAVANSKAHGLVSA